MSAPLLLIQLDSLDPGLATEWMARGELPVLESIRRAGCASSIGGTEMFAELGSALSLFSGLSRARHGYYDYRQLVPGTYTVKPVSAADADTPPFWTRLGSDRSVAAIDAAETYVYPQVRGRQLAYWTAHQASTSIVPSSASTPDVLQTAARVFGDRTRIPEYLPASSEAEDLRAGHQLIERIRRKGDLIRALVGETHHDLVVAGFYEAHTAGHRFWKWRSRGESSPLGRALLEVYKALDVEVGRLLEHMPDANVMVFSLYGLLDQYPTEELTHAAMRELGYAPACAAGSSSPARRSPVDLMRAAIPDGVREAISRRLPGAMQERLLASAFTNGTDWSRTTAFALPSLFAGFIRVNLAGREPAGIVQHGEYEQLLDRIEADLHALVDPVDGASPIARIHRTAHAYGGPTLALPDLVVEWAPSRRFRERLIHPRAELRQRPPAYFRDNFHSLRGMLLAKGPDIRARSDVGMMDVLDFAPTSLALLGEKIPEEFTGRVSPMVSRAFDARDARP